jgi:hypothetical protein
LQNLVSDHYLTHASFHHCPHLHGCSGLRPPPNTEAKYPHSRTEAKYPRFVSDTIAPTMTSSIRMPRASTLRSCNIPRHRGGSRTYPIQMPDLLVSERPRFCHLHLRKSDGDLVASTPSGIQDLCWERGVASSACATPSRKRGLGVPRRRESVTRYGISCCEGGVVHQKIGP